MAHHFKRTNQTTADRRTKSSHWSKEPGFMVIGYMLDCWTVRYHVPPASDKPPLRWLFLSCKVVTLNDDDGWRGTEKTETIKTTWFWWNTLFHSHRSDLDQSQDYLRKWTNSNIQKNLIWYRHTSLRGRICSCKAVSLWDNECDFYFAFTLLLSTDSRY